MKDELNASIELRHYQREGVSFLLGADGALLGDQMGLGKTIQAIIAAQVGLHQRLWGRVLIVAPYSLLLNWHSEFGKWAPDLPVQRVQGDSQDRAAFYKLPIPVLIASYDQIRSDAVTLPSDLSFDLVVLDEAQRIKNADSMTAFACRLLPRTRSWALTGTPIENSVRDLISVFRFVRPGLLKLGMPRKELHRLMQPHFLRRTKTDVLPELPPLIVQDLELELTGRQGSAYDDLWERRTEVLNETGDPPTEMHLFSLITKLKQICNFDPASGESVKLDALRSVLESSTEETDKVLVFSQYVKTLQWLGEQLQGQSCEILHGEIPIAERSEMIRRFETLPGPRTLLVSLRAGGVGLNLQAASVVVLFDRWWNPAVEQQAIERAHRFGRHEPLEVFRFTVKHTIEERIETLLKGKQDLFNEYVERADTATVKGFTREELAAVLGLRLTDIKKNEVSA